MKPRLTEQELASPSQRFTARIIDSLLAVLFSLPLFFSDSMAAGLMALGLGVSYFFLADVVFGAQSIGKRVCGIRVANATTLGPCGFGQGILRMAFLIPPMFITEGLILLSSGMQRRGDRIARTCVLRIIPLPDPEERPLRPMQLENLQDILHHRPKGDEEK